MNTLNSPEWVSFKQYVDKRWGELSLNLPGLKDIKAMSDEERPAFETALKAVMIAMSSDTREDPFDVAPALFTRTSANNAPIREYVPTRSTRAAEMILRAIEHTNRHGSPREEGSDQDSVSTYAAIGAIGIRHRFTPSDTMVEERESFVLTNLRTLAVMRASATIDFSEAADAEPDGGTGSKAVRVTAIVSALTLAAPKETV